MADGSRSVRGKRRHGLGWVPWLAALLLVAIAVGVVLLVTNVSDENDNPGIDVTDDERARTESSPAGPDRS